MKALTFLLYLTFPFSLLCNNTIKLYTTEQQWGVVDLDYFEITSDTLTEGIVYESEYPSGFTVGFPIPRGNASNQLVWGQLGDEDGEVWYDNVSGSGQNYIRVRYSRNHFLEAPPVQIFVNGELQGSWIPQNTGNWNIFQTTQWIPIEFSLPPSDTAYYHPFQNFDDDVVRLKKFSNFFTRVVSTKVIENQIGIFAEKRCQQVIKHSQQTGNGKPPPD